MENINILLFIVKIWIKIIAIEKNIWAKLKIILNIIEKKLHFWKNFKGLYLYIKSMYQFPN